MDPIFLHASCVYWLFQTGQHDADTMLLMDGVFEEVCAELGLAQREDRLRDLVAAEILQCVGGGERDSNHIRLCTRTAWNIGQP